MTSNTTYQGIGLIASNTLRQDFSRIGQIHGWSRSKRDTERANFYEAEFVRLTEYDSETLSTQQAWVRFCANIGRPVPNDTSIRKCKQNLAGLYVNIVDYLDGVRSGRVPVLTFTNKSDFIRRTKKKGMMFPKVVAKRNRFLKELLEIIS